MVAVGKESKREPKDVGGKHKVFTKQHKQKLIERFKAEMRNKEEQYRDSVDREVELLRLKFNNRLNKILRKFWDVKIEDVLKIEREMKNDTPLTLFNVIKQLQSSKSEDVKQIDSD